MEPLLSSANVTDRTTVVRAHLPSIITQTTATTSSSPHTNHHHTNTTNSTRTHSLLDSSSEGGVVSDMESSNSSSALPHHNNTTVRSNPELNLCVCRSAVSCGIVEINGVYKIVVSSLLQEQKVPKSTADSK